MFHKQKNRHPTDTHFMHDALTYFAILILNYTSTKTKPMANSCKHTEQNYSQVGKNERNPKRYCDSRINSSLKDGQTDICVVILLLLPTDREENA